MTRLGLSARAYDRILKVSRTIAVIEDLRESASCRLTEVVDFRSPDRYCSDLSFCFK